MYSRKSTAHCPKAVHHCSATLSLALAPRNVVLYRGSPMPITASHCSNVSQEFHYPLPLRNPALHHGRSTTKKMKVLPEGTANSPLHSFETHLAKLLREFQCPVHEWVRQSPVKLAVPTGAVRHSRGEIPVPTAPRQKGSFVRELQCPLRR